MPISSRGDSSYRSEIRRMFQRALGSLYENLGALGIVLICSCLGAEKKTDMNRETARPGATKL